MVRLILAALLLLGLAACGDPAADSKSAPPAAHPAPRTIALVMKTLTNPFFVDMERGARKAQRELGIELVVKTAAQETSIEQQIAIIEELVRQRVDAIVVAPGDSFKLIPSLRLAQQEGIVVVNVDNRLDPGFAQRTGLTGVPFISVDNAHGAYLAARYLASRLHQPGRALILEGIRSAANAEARKQGALKAFHENPLIGEIRLESADWKIDQGYEVTLAMLALYPDLRVIFAANDMMALGAAQAVRSRQRSGILIAGFDALAEARAALAAGEIEATVDQRAAEQGYLGVRYAVDLLSGRRPPAETLVGVELLTRDAAEP